MNRRIVLLVASFSCCADIRAQTGTVSELPGLVPPALPDAAKKVAIFVDAFTVPVPRTCEPLMKDTVPLQQVVNF